MRTRDLKADRGLLPWAERRLSTNRRATGAALDWRTVSCQRTWQAGNTDATREREHRCGSRAREAAGRDRSWARCQDEYRRRRAQPGPMKARRILQSAIANVWLLLLGGLVRRRGERHITRSAGNLHPGVKNRAERNLTGGRAAGCRCSARGGDEDIDLLTDKHRKCARREFVDRLQHSCIHSLSRVSRQ